MSFDFERMSFGLDLWCAINFDFVFWQVICRSMVLFNGPNAEGTPKSSICDKNVFKWVTSIKQSKLDSRWSWTFGCLWVLISPFSSELMIFIGWFLILTFICHQFDICLIINKFRQLLCKFVLDCRERFLAFGSPFLVFSFPFLVFGWSCSKFCSPFLAFSFALLAFACRHCFLVCHFGAQHLSSGFIFWVWVIAFRFGLPFLVLRLGTVCQFIINGAWLLVCH